MDVALTISPDNSPRRRIASYTVALGVSLIIATFLRVSLLAIYPLVVLLILSYYKFRITSSFILLTSLVCLSFAASMFGGIFIKYKLLSLFYMLPFLVLLFCHPAPEKNSKIDQLSIFFTSLSIVAFVNDVIGFVQLVLNPKSDDSFVGVFTQYSISINGLMLINSVLFFYYFVVFLKHRTLLPLFATIFFSSCAILGFYGAGLVVVFLAFVLAFFRFRVLAVIKTVTAALAAFGIIILTMYLVKPLALEYNVANVKKLMNFDPETAARKVTSFYNYGISYPKNAKDFLLGSGPGTFNSRSAFMVGSPSYFQHIAFIKDSEQPYYFKHFAYTLWNEKNTRQDMYLDGFRNQPFSSILAFLGEYGLIFTLAFAMCYVSYYRHVARIFYRSPDKKSMFVQFRLFKFLIVLLPLLLLIDNFLEYPEIMILVILALKLAHSGMVNQKSIDA